MRLSLYLNDTAAIMNDPTYSFVSQFQMTRWINEARRLLAIETGCIRRHVTGQSAFGAQSRPARQFLPLSSPARCRKRSTWPGGPPPRVYRRRSMARFLAR